MSAASSTEDLMTLGRLLTEVGGFASTVMSRTDIQFAAKCRRKAARIEKELLRRGVVKKFNDIFSVLSENSNPGEEVPLYGLRLREMTVSELEQLYRSRSRRIEAKITEGREYFTRYTESRIVEELKTRCPANQSEQLKTDYCLITHRMEMTNMAMVLSIPLGHPIDLASMRKEVNSMKTAFSVEEFPNSVHLHGDIPTKLAEVISIYGNFHTISEREALIEVTDMALDFLHNYRLNDVGYKGIPIDSANQPKNRGRYHQKAKRYSKDIQLLAGLLAELVELRRKETIKIPAWVGEMLVDAVAAWEKCPAVPDTDMVIPLLTLSLFLRTQPFKSDVDSKHSASTFLGSRDSSASLRNRNTSASDQSAALERKAQRIINKCYRSCISGTGTPAQFNIATTCSTYVPRYNPSKLITLFP